MSYKHRDKDNNQFGMDFSYPGVCSLCFDEIGEFNGSNKDGKPIVMRFKKNYRELYILLDDNSQMLVTMCDDCYENLKPKDLADIMESEILGWNHELNTVLKDKWDDEKKKKYKDKYNNLNVLNRMDKPYGPKDMLEISDRAKELKKNRRNT